jgi:hypothetical protein
MITKALVGLSALIAAGLGSVYDAPEGQVSAAAAVEARFPTATERFARPDQLMLSPVSMLQTVPASLAPAANAAPKRDKIPAPADCAGQDWPYISAECLITADAETLKKQVRRITIERRFGDSTSMLTVQAVRVAGR